MQFRNEMDAQAPGGLYLCQVSENVSCGACCGLYNVADPSREALTRMLMRRTMLFKTVARDGDAIEAFGRLIAAKVNGKRPFPEFHHCPFTGLIGPDHSRVGCLLHPLADDNHGADFRGLSFHGGLACSAYFCPSCTRSPKPLKELIRRAATDWYSYGLIITEVELLCSIFDQLKLRCDNGIEGLILPDNDACLALGRQLLDLKISWPFQPNSTTDRVNYFFKDNLYGKPAVHYGENATYTSRYDKIFKNLVSTFHTPDQIHRAEEIIDRLIEKLAAAFSRYVKKVIEFV
jgi:hypothetical protein